MSARTRAAVIGIPILLAMLAIPGVTQAAPPVTALTGAIFTTDSACSGVDVNIYLDKNDVYLDGGPDGHPHAAGLPDGYYYVKLTTPSGNLLGTSIGSGNDTPVHVTSGSFDACYRLSAILIKATDATPGYDTTTNQGGEYKVWVSRDSDFASKKTDNFKVKSSEVNCDEHPSDPACLVAQGELKVVKYYDASTDGTHATISEPDILSWEVRIDGPNLAADFELTTVDKFVEPGDYKVEESTPLEANWIHTTATVVNPATVTNGGTTLVEFGNVCVGAGGGLTLGFWSNKNGEAAMKDGSTLMPELALLSSRNLRTAAGLNFDPATYASFRNWILNATATNMAYMLSAQLATMELNVEAGFVSGSSLIYAPGTGSANLAGFATVNAVMAEANSSLGANGLTIAAGPVRTSQEALKNALDKANNNLNFVQATPANCPFTFPVVP